MALKKLQNFEKWDSSDSVGHQFANEENLYKIILHNFFAYELNPTII
jgi:hypothetical protein